MSMDTTLTNLNLVLNEWALEQQSTRWTSVSRFKRQSTWRKQ